MTNEKDELMEVANSPVGYWKGLKTTEFWQQFGQEGRLTSFIVCLSILFVELSVLLWNFELNSKFRINHLLLVVGIAIWVVDQFIVNPQKDFQFAKQLEIVRAAQKLEFQETREEEADE